MTGDKEQSGEKRLSPPAVARDPQSGEPDWADGLRGFYSAVSSEPVPDAFSDLIKKLENLDNPEPEN